MNVQINLVLRVIPAPLPALVPVTKWNKREIILVSLCAALIFASLAFNLFSFQKNRRLSAENDALSIDNQALKKDKCKLSTENDVLGKANRNLDIVINALKEGVGRLSNENSSLRDENYLLDKKISHLNEVVEIYRQNFEERIEAEKDKAVKELATYSH